MVAPLGPGKFYGSSLPRPRFYTDVKHNTERVDPPVSVLDPLLSWATDAHWTMGGLSFNRLRLQGRIEGNVEKLRIQRQKLAKKHARSSVSPISGKGRRASTKKAPPSSLSPPPAPIASKRRYMAPVEEENDYEIEEEGLEKELLVDDDEGKDEEGKEEGPEPVRLTKKKPARKLYDEFNGVADKMPEVVGNEAVKASGQLKRVSSKRASSKRASSKTSVSGGSKRTSPRLLSKVSLMDSDLKTRTSRRLVKRS
ncbi:hypothetical protein SAY87_006059 [Trapa incisa]|uniref:Uncharacterized protein n=1 Tax=Trapa incisa TaxID=236973 RepID=A0AAN7KBL5_9MYRT|nr:hypothetical protein SAY87_006059 [Trapa incisa]